MSPETPYRIAVLVVLVVAMAVTVRFRLQAARSGERISRREEGLAFAVVLRLAGVGLWLAVLAYLLNPAWVAWAALPLPAWLRCSGVVAGLASAGLMYWTLSNLGKNLTDTVVTRAEATLVTGGPYRYVRHPFYVTAAILMFSVALASASALVAAASAVILAMLAVRTPKEEANLIARFGDDYRRYMQTTGRFLPRLRR